MLHVAALILATSFGGVEAPAFHVDDWRDDLPLVAQAAVQKIDEKTEASSKADAQLAKDIDKDIELGKKYAEEVDKELKPSENAEMIARVQTIGAQLAEIANSAKVDVLWGDPRHARFPYTFKVVKGDDVNAFSIPGGYIYVYEGLVNFAESDHELASVLAHEISHAAFRHIATLAKEQSKVESVTLPLILAAILTGGTSAIGTAIMAGSMATQAFVSGWSVQAEIAADYGAIQFMVRSHYNPVGELTFMERLAFSQKLNPRVDWGIYQTHPPSERRAAYLIKELRARGYAINRSEVSTSQAASVSPVDDGRLELSFGPDPIMRFGGDDALARADQAEANMNRLMDAIPEIYEIVVSEDGTVRGQGRVIFQVRPEDLAPGETMPLTIAKVRNNLQKAAFLVSYRVWGSQID